MPAVTRPPEPRTGYSHPSCYARALADCDTKLSREHYISKTLLERLAPLTIEGALWAVERRSITPKAIAAKVLCKRHNEALSDVDTAITGLYDALMRWHRGEHVGDHVVDGEDIERWAIKAMLGYMTSGIARGLGGGKMLASSVPDGYVRVLFGEQDLEDRCGLYLTDPWLPPGHAPGGVSMTVALAKGGPHAGKLAGLLVSIANVPFLVTVAAEVRSEARYRPSEIRLDDSGKLTFRWATRHTGGGVYLFSKEAP